MRIGPGLSSRACRDPPSRRFTDPRFTIQPGCTLRRVMTDSRSRITRRDALELLGLSAAAAMIPAGASAQAPTFPRGAIIRTLLKDYAPDELAGGATLFHEHMSLGTDFNARFTPPPPRPARAQWTTACPTWRTGGSSRVEPDPVDRQLPAPDASPAQQPPQRRTRCPIRS